MRRSTVSATPPMRMEPQPYGGKDVWYAALHTAAQWSKAAPEQVGAETKTRVSDEGQAHAIVATLDVQTAGEPVLPPTSRLPVMPPSLPRRTLQDDAFRQERIRQVEAQLLASAGNDREGMVALDTYGADVFTKIGGRDEIVFTRDEIEMMAGCVDLITHNHDDGSAFSIEDVAFAAALDARELNVFGRDLRWRLVRGGAAWPSLRSVSAAFNRADRQVQRELFRQKRSGVFEGNPFAWADRSGYVWQRLQRDHAEWFIVVREVRLP